MAMNGDLIALVNKLQDTFNTIGGDAVDLPQIVVVGSQSSGKSSVLETIVGRDFLPRGSGIVTRRPLILQLIHTPARGDGSAMTGGYQLQQQDLPTPSPPQTEYAEFLHLNRRFTDFDEIRREIEAETFRVAGQNKGVSKLPINLKIYGPGVLNLTLVDLPGLTKVPVGDQPTDIERQIKNLILDYISKPNAVILAVSPANQDIANSDSLKLARSVDPRGLRTIGVLTKLDLMDAGTNALDILTGRTYPLKLGFIGVVNRSQQDINAGLPMEEALRKEEDFFRNHPAYRNLAHRCGTKYLAKSLNHVLMNHIRDKLPDMKARLNTLMGQTQQELNSFGDATFLGEQHRTCAELFHLGLHQQGSLVLKLMTEFARDFVASIDGTSMELSTKELCGGARIYYIFHDVFGMALESVDPTQNLTTQDIRTAIRNSTGPRPSLFVPEIAFDLLIKPQIKLLESPSLRCVELVYEELMKICHNCTSAELQRFPRLHAQIVEVVSELLRERLGPTSDYASSLISIQAAYINTNHPEFVAGSAAIARGELPAGSKSIPFIKAPTAEEDADDDVSDSEASEHGNVNGTQNAINHKSRSVSHSQPGDRRQPIPVAPTPRHLGDPKTDKYRAGSLSGIASAPPPSGLMSMSNVSTSPHSTRETFLNYFFGGAGGPGGPAGSGGVGVGASGIQQRNDGRTARDLLPDLGTRKATSAGMNVGRGHGLDSSPAYDMKSLGKHLEAADSGHGLRLTPREEMETTLIRSLIASYFNIVRQMIQDLVPKAIMHLLVNFSKESVQQRLVTSLYKPDLFPDLLHEDEALVSERTRVKALLDAYKEAFNLAVCAADRVAEGGACSQSNNKLIAGTGNFVSDCDARTFCNDQGVCQAKGCRKDYYPYGYNGVDWDSLPPLCSSTQFCPDEGDACQDKIPVGELCQLNRDDECAFAPNYQDLAGRRNVNGSVCLNFRCYWANATIGQACVFENHAYESYASDGSTYASIISRDNCVNGYYCDGSSATCYKDKQVGDACTANKECLSYNCVDGTCRKATDDPNHPRTWVYAIVAVLIILCITAVLVGLYYIHRKSREENRIKLEQYEAEQMAYRKSIMALSQARNSLFALGPHATSDVAKQSLLAADSYTYKDNEDYTSRRSSFLRDGWSNNGSSDHHEDTDVLLVPGGRSDRHLSQHVGQAM
ncbi:hypothetical protein QFC24_003099 [Naganishia onofrii]|uniref:Uncharacterized protein n=1 Tax=Naganishia onofrii TaxID=1851511 RepID=A0ACC2XM83_9TREE|nr:hypothetical protein QFC24_003099 [Naganishia onofrii]